jgi:DNA-binding transcriptional LysR family regulator
VGLKLFDRDRRKLAPTKECLALFHEVQRTYAGLDNIARAANAIRTMQTGSLSIVAMPILSMSFVPRVIAAFAAEHRDVAISLWTWPREQALDWVTSRQYDLGFLTLPIGSEAVTVEPFVALDSVCVMPADHRLAAKSVIEPADLNGENLVSFTPGTPHRHAVEAVLREQNVRARTTIEARSAAAVLALVDRGLGVAVVGSIAVEDSAPRHVVSRPFRAAIPFEAGLVYPRGLPLSGVARRFADRARSLYPQPFAALSQKRI